MKVLVAKRKDEKKLRYYNGKMFVVGKNHAIDISIRNSDEVIQKFIDRLYEYLDTTAEKGMYEYYTMDI